MCSHTGQIEQMHTKSQDALFIWKVRDKRADLFLDGAKVGEIPVAQFPKMIRDMANELDR